MTKKQPAAKAKRVRQPQPFMAGRANMMCRAYSDGSRDIATGSGLIADVPAAISWLRRAAAWVADAPKSKGAR